MKKEPFMQTKVKSYLVFLKKQETALKSYVYQSTMPKRTTLLCSVTVM